MAVAVSLCSGSTVVDVMVGAGLALICSGVLVVTSEVISFGSGVLVVGTL